MTTKIIDLYTEYVRNINNKKLKEYLNEAWKEDPIKTIAVIFNCRDRINGKKEKKISNNGMIWLKKFKPLTYKLNILNYINNYGCWKDLLYINYFSSILDNYELNLIAEQLIKDKSNLINNKEISLCAKWSPSEKDRNDRRKDITLRLSKIITNDSEKSLEIYRKEYIVPLRKKIKIIETLMCNKKWDEINYEHVPGIASKKYKNAFMKHDKERYQTYLKDVKNGLRRLNITGILPHELIKYYIDLKRKGLESYEKDETIELIWKRMIDDIKNEGIFDKIIPCCDVSGSMECDNNLPLTVSIGLGILISQCTTGIYKNKIITFSQEPLLFEVKGETLFDLYNSMIKMNFGLNTDFEKVSDLIINYGKINNINNDDMIKKIIVFTDMQFDKASSSENNINILHNKIINKYKNNNYEPPEFIYWNLKSSNSFPINITTEGTMLLSGFSEQLLKIIMKNKNIKPSLIIEEILKPYIREIQIDETEI